MNRIGETLFQDTACLTAENCTDILPFDSDTENRMYFYTLLECVAAMKEKYGAIFTGLWFIQVPSGDGRTQFCYRTSRKLPAKEHIQLAGDVYHYTKHELAYPITYDDISNLVSIPIQEWVRDGLVFAVYDACREGLHEDVPAPPPPKAQYTHVHFGCGVRYPERSKLTREDYAVIDSRAYRNTFHRVKRYYYKEMYTIVHKYSIPEDQFDNDLRTEVNDLVYQTFTAKDQQEIGEYIETAKRLRENPDEVKAIRSQMIEEAELILSEKQASQSPIVEYMQQKLEKIKSMSDEQIILSKAPNVLMAYWMSVMKKKTYDLKWLLEHFSEIPISFQYNFHAREYPYYTEAWVEKQRACALENFDLNMKYWTSLDKEEFDAAIEAFKVSYPDFIEIDDLRPYRMVPGVYVMILDEYKQIYIGISERGLKERIQAHWANHKEFDRLIFGGVQYSILSIDCFGHFDTTRIFVKPYAEQKKSNSPKAKITVDASLFHEEARLVEKAFPQKFLLNRTAGGEQSFLGAIIDRKTRDFDEESRDFSAVNEEVS